MTTAVTSTDLPFPLARRGKVRDVYHLPGDPPRVLLVATDRISAFDVVMRTPIPGKGRLLTEISRRWFEFIEARGVTPTHALGWALDPDTAAALPAEQRAALDGRVCVARASRVMPVECVVRGYLDGSGWAEYQRSGAVCGVALPPGLRRGDRLPDPIFTPATKAEDGAHDENISYDEAVAIAGERAMARARDVSLAIYNAAHAHAEARGIILADTKFEFGFPRNADGSADAEPVLIDEALTPDSSRYWPADGWAPGGAQPSFDKQYVREHLQGLVDRGAWDKTAGGDGLGPALPGDVVEGTVARYREALERLWGGPG